jgi:hypothetical protein
MWLALAAITLAAAIGFNVLALAIRVPSISPFRWASSRGETPGVR